MLLVVNKDNCSVDIFETWFVVSESIWDEVIPFSLSVDITFICIVVNPDIWEAVSDNS